MCRHWKGFKKDGRDSEHEDCYETFKKLVRNFEYSKSDSFKKPSVLAQIRKLQYCQNSLFLIKKYVYIRKWNGTIKV